MNPSIPISVLMVGCGGFARRYHVPAFDDDGAISIVGIFDPFPTPQTRALAERCGAALTARIEDLPRPEGLAFSLVTTPHTLHADHIAAMLDRRMNVLVDKPYVMTAADATRLAERADEIGVANAVAYNRRFDRGCLRAREILRAGGIGDVRFVQTVQLGYERAGWFLDPTLGGGGPVYRAGYAHGGSRPVAARTLAYGIAQPPASWLADTQRPWRVHRTEVRRSRVSDDLHRGRLAHVG